MLSKSILLVMAAVILTNPLTPNAFSTIQPVSPHRRFSTQLATQSSHHRHDTTPLWKTVRQNAARIRVKFNTLESAGISLQQQNQSSSYPNTKTLPPLHSKIGFMGHSKLLLASTLFVVLAKVFWKTLQQSRGIELQEEEGMMDRCPWPFIFTHDPIQGLKDSPTWIMVTWLAMWRLLKWKNGKLM